MQNIACCIDFEWQYFQERNKTILKRVENKFAKYNALQKYVLVSCLVSLWKTITYTTQQSLNIYECVGVQFYIYDPEHSRFDERAYISLSLTHTYIEINKYIYIYNILNITTVLNYYRKWVVNRLNIEIRWLVKALYYLRQIIRKTQNIYSSGRNQN